MIYDNVTCQIVSQIKLVNLWWELIVRHVQTFSQLVDKSICAQNFD